MNVRPLHDRIIVQRLEESAPEPGAIIIPDSAREKPQRGKIAWRSCVPPFSRQRRRVCDPVHASIAHVTYDRERGQFPSGPASCQSSKKCQMRKRVDLAARTITFRAPTRPTSRPTLL